MAILHPASNTSLHRNESAAVAMCHWSNLKRPIQIHSPCADKGGVRIYTAHDKLFAASSRGCSGAPSRESGLSRHPEEDQPVAKWFCAFVD